MGVYPVLALLAYNMGEVMIEDTLRSLVASLVGVTCILLVVRLFIRDLHRAAIVSTLAVLLFSSYGHIYSFLKTVIVFGESLDRHRYLLPVWLTMFGVGIWLFWKRLRSPQAWSEVLNVIVALSLAFPVFKIIVFEIRMYSAQERHADTLVQDMDLWIPEGESPPDVYYIVLDTYARDDVLRTFYEYDNTPFMQHLTEMGFYIAHRSQSNYSQTALSLASSLNLNYVQELGEMFISGSDDRSDLVSLVKKNAVMQTFENLGYTIIAFKTGVPLTEFNDADIFFVPKDKTITYLQFMGKVNGFEAMLIQTTAARVLTDSAHLRRALLPQIDYPYQVHRDRILSILDKLEQIPSIEGSKFIFAHILCPHSPFVFGPNGEPLNPDEPFTLAEVENAPEGRERIFRYLNQVTFISKRIEKIVEEIIAHSEVTPIIIVQSDHGGTTHKTPSEASVAILNAYYLPGGEAYQLYDSISPVNSFRVIFNIYFGGDYDLLDDVAYYSSYDDPYNFQFIPNEPLGIEDR